MNMLAKETVGIANMLQLKIRNQIQDRGTLRGILYFLQKMKKVLKI